MLLDLILPSYQVLKCVGFKFFLFSLNISPHASVSKELESVSFGELEPVSFLFGLLPQVSLLFAGNLLSLLLFF